MKPLTTQLATVLFPGSPVSVNPVNPYFSPLVRFHICSGPPWVSLGLSSYTPDESLALRIAVSSRHTLLLSSVTTQEGSQPSMLGASPGGSPRISITATFKEVPLGTYSGPDFTEEHYLLPFHDLDSAHFAGLISHKSLLLRIVFNALALPCL